MTSREKLLALLVGLLVLGMGVFWIGSTVQDAFKTRATNETRKLEQLKKQDFTLKRAILADRDLRDYKSRSLPSNLELARAQYEAWLAKLLASAEIAKPQFQCKSKPKRKSDDPVTITWRVSGTGGLDQLNELLYQYYSLDTLHRMSALKLVTIPESRNLQISFDTQVLVLANTEPENKLDPTRKSAWAIAHGPEHVAKIVERNMMSRANIRPNMASVSDQTVTVGKTLEVRLQAEDPNEFDELKFTLVDPLPGAKVDPRSGRLEWRPQAVGEYKLLARVDDDGIPSKSAMREIRIRVLDPPPPPPKPEPPAPEPPKPTVDEAMFTYATGQVRVNGKPQVWLKVRTSGQTLKLGEGDAIKVGSVDGIVSKINDRSFELTMGDDKREVLRGEPLVAMPAPETSAADDEAEEAEEE